MFKLNFTARLSIEIPDRFRTKNLKLKRSFLTLFLFDFIGISSDLETGILGKLVPMWKTKIPNTVEDGMDPIHVLWIGWKWISDFWVDWMKPEELRWF
ncbi:uncharacterized protein OCT59_003506 [Rhizophagus irregularis]|uniref:uncharacterized protein n=1 Tax=Rhizophagus irregularis TaxID=588596 RepID=UPI0019E6F25A|nr:hypothetical protein OCT59_003506 [Rhizophagus irregularis]GET63851.1 hypothetical protein RIR_jg29703.t1 [Rhizophagus irregularis DAOM 181602=DAOM 197198]